MKYWEFLIQKEGDETWLPLETQQVEILEGRYRVVAHTDRVNAPMEIRVSQLITHEMPPRKRVRKRQGETNDAGLVVVMPYVQLKPGQWDLSCSSLDNSTDDSWRYQVQLQVFAHTEDDWSSEWPVPADSFATKSPAAEGRTESANGIASATTQNAAPLVQAQAQLQDNLQRQGQWSSPVDVPVDLSYSISLQQQAFLARRNQAMTITGQVQALVDSPHIQGASQLWLRLQNPQTAQVIMEAHRPLSLDRLPADFKVKIQLPTNVTTRVVLGEVSLRSASPDESEPAKILTSTAFTITAGIALLLDDIANKDPGEFEEESVLFEKADGSSNSSSNSPIDTIASHAPDLVSPILAPTYKTAVPAVGVVLPPRLDLNGQSSDGHTYSIERPELPTFPSTGSAQPLTVNDPPAALDEAGIDERPSEQGPSPVLPDYSSLQQMVSQPAQFMGTSIGDDDLEASQIAALLEDIDDDLSSQASGMDELEAPGIEGALPHAQTPHQRSRSQSLSHASDLRASNLDSLSHAEAVGSESPRFFARSEQQVRSQRQTKANTAFESLKLKDHFWQRLTNLTHESHQEATQLADNMKKAGVLPNSQGSVRSFKPDWLADLPANSEVVIYDEPAMPDAAPSTSTDLGAPSAHLPSPASLPAAASTQSQSQRLHHSYRQNGLTSQHSEATSLSPTLGSANSRFTRRTLSEELPEMALPVISVPNGDLVAGDTVTITVRSQPSAYKPFIKLWMVDRQSRTLVGEAKLLTNLKPDALGYLETSADLRVPMGCLDVQIAAIAVDMATQQESNKAIVNRHVVPSRQFPPLRNL